MKTQSFRFTRFMFQPFISQTTKVIQNYNSSIFYIFLEIKYECLVNKWLTYKTFAHSIKVINKVMVNHNFMKQYTYIHI